jgi:hypothetical protein
MLSSSGALVSEAQPAVNQATASTLIISFMDCSDVTRRKTPNSQCSQSLIAALRADFEIWRLCYRCNFRSSPENASCVFVLRANRLELGPDGQLPNRRVYEHSQFHVAAPDTEA